MTIGHFGPGIIGEEQYEAEKEHILENRDLFGPGVLDSHPCEDAPPSNGEPEPEAPPVVDPELEPYLASVKKIKEILAANPLEVDGFMHAEFQRADGLRKTALQAMLDAEQERPGPDGGTKPRSEVVTTLEGALASLEE